MQEGIRNFKGHNFAVAVKFDGDDWWWWLVGCVWVLFIFISFRKWK